MGKVDDYINGLDGQSDLDPIKIAKDISELHNQEYGAVTAKVEQQDNLIKEQNKKLADAQSEISKQKAMNFDLSMQLPGDGKSERNADENIESGDPDVTIADLFSENVRKRNPLLRGYNA